MSWMFKSPGSALILVPRYHRPQRFKVKSLDSANPRADGCFTLAQVASLQANWGALRPAPHAQTLRGPIHLPREITGLGTYCAEKIQEKSPGLMFQSWTSSRRGDTWVLSDGSRMPFSFRGVEMASFPVSSACTTVSE